MDAVRWRVEPGSHWPGVGRPQFSAMNWRIVVWSWTLLSVRSMVGLARGLALFFLPAAAGFRPVLRA